MKISQEIVCIIKGFHQAGIALLHAPNHAGLELNYPAPPTVASATRRCGDPSLTGTSCPGFSKERPQLNLRSLATPSPLLTWASVTARLADIDSHVNEIKWNWREI